LTEKHSSIVPFVGFCSNPSPVSWSNVYISYTENRKSRKKDRNFIFSFRLRNLTGRGEGCSLYRPRRHEREFLSILFYGGEGTHSKHRSHEYASCSSMRNCAQYNNVK
jgi:hypothetical protein